MQKYFAQCEEEQMEMRKLVEATMANHQNTKEARNRLQLMKQKIGRAAGVTMHGDCVWGCTTNWWLTHCAYSPTGGQRKSGTHGQSAGGGRELWYIPVLLCCLWCMYIYREDICSFQCFGLVVWFSIPGWSGDASQSRADPADSCHGECSHH